MDKPFFTMFVDQSKKNVLVIGAGVIAGRRIENLCEFTDNLTVVAPEISTKVRELSEKYGFTVNKRRYEKEDIFEADIVFAATNNREVNADIARDCEEEGILVNISTDRDKCDFYFPGLVRKGDIVVGVSASGKDHTEAKLVTEFIRKMLV